LVDEVVARDDRLHALQLLGLGGVDAPDARVRMRAAQHLAGELAGQIVVGAEPGAAGDLVDTIGPNGTRADDLELGGGLGIADTFLHGSSPPHLGGSVHHGTYDLVVAGAAAK